MAKKIIDPGTLTWVQLNDIARNCDEITAYEMMKKELAGRCRQQYVHRLHARYNRLRYDRECVELAAKRPLKPTEVL